MTRKLQQGTETDLTAASVCLDEDTVFRDYGLGKLDPTQCAFADRVLKWASEVVGVHKHISATGSFRGIPRLRSWLGWSAGSGKSTTLKTIVQHARLLFQQANIDVTVELTAYTSVAAFNIGFWGHDVLLVLLRHALAGETFGRLEGQWRRVELLIADEIAVIGRAFFTPMRFRSQQAERRCFNEAAFDRNEYTFGDVALLLVGDFGQLEPFDDWCMSDIESTYQTNLKHLRHMWRRWRYGNELLQTFEMALLQPSLANLRNGPM